MSAGIQSYDTSQNANGSPEVVSGGYIKLRVYRGTTRQCVTSRSVHLGAFKTIRCDFVNLMNQHMFVGITVYKASDRKRITGGSVKTYGSTTYSLDVSAINEQCFVVFTVYTTEEGTTETGILKLNNIQFLT